ncbi:MAG: hypothetical protein IKH36_01855 [Bacilli bacterium]|nr:hypothetical protein [Bacilli bacterium]
MIDLFDKFFVTIIETIVITPIFITIILLLLLAAIFYPIKKINRWLIKQVQRILDIWIYYINKAYKYEENNE